MSVFGQAVKRLSACRLRRDHAPAGRKNRTVEATKKNIIVEIPDRCLASARVVKQVVRVDVAIEIGSPLQLIPACNGRPVGAADKRNSRQIPDGRLARAGIEE